MKRHRLVATVLILVSTLLNGPVWADNEKAPPAREPTVSDEPSSDPRQAAAELLNGREVVLRLYVAWKTDPKAYTTLKVPLAGLDVTCDAVRQAYGASKLEPAPPPDGPALQLDDETRNLLDRELKDAVIAVVPGDQQDAAITGVMSDCIFGDLYRSGQRFTLWPGISSVQLHPCVFLDALLQPIANAEVEILLADYPRYYTANIKVWIGNAKLDANGRMQSPKASYTGKLACFVFVVLHPDCGPVPAWQRIENYTPGADFLYPIGALPRDKWCTFVDALGNPMAGATVQVFQGWKWEDRSSTPYESIRLDEGGRLRPPIVQTTLDGCSFLVTDPNYGTALVEPMQNRVSYPEPLLPAFGVVPLVKAGTEADARSLRGIVLDPDNHPIKEAIVQSQVLSVPGGGALYAFFGAEYWRGKDARVLTDDEGRFALYLPLANQDGTLGRPVPPAAQYRVDVEAPQELRLYAYHGTLPAGQEHTIILPSPTSNLQGYSGTLLFQDEFGPVTDPNKLRQVYLAVRIVQPDGSATFRTYGGGDWIGLQELPFGVYSATANWDGKYYVFEPVEVTAQSPAVVVFRPQEVKAARTVYRGRVLHGVTGAPIVQAIVMRRPRTGLQGRLPDEYFTELFYLGPECDPNGELFRLLEEHPELGITRTDENGRFETTLPIVSDAQTLGVETLIAIKKDFLGAEQWLGVPLPGVDANGQRRFEIFKPDRTGKVPLPDMKLFPAGTVMIEPNVPDDGPGQRDKDVSFLYFTAADDPTPWLKNLWAVPSANKGTIVFRKNKLLVNQLQSVYVPADVGLTLEISRRAEEFGLIVIPDVRLRQGEILDLGRVEFPVPMQVSVKVIDSAGHPLEGINVVCYNEFGWRLGPAAVTSVEGVAYFYVAPNSQGSFAVERQDPESTNRVRESTPYEVGGPEDAGREFVLTLSDAFVEQLLKGRAGR